MKEIFEDFGMSILYMTIWNLLAAIFAASGAMLMG